jgi:predicted Ser/Thr protein kinase
MRSFAPGTPIGPYVVERELARGGMGAVYRARRSQDNAVVALKVLHAGAGATDEQRERFRREGELAARLTHPGIVRVHAAGSISWLNYIAMDLVDGESLAAHAGRLAPLEAARLLAEVARAIEYAHAHGVVHRDLKPGNVLVRRDDRRALVTDFGIARHIESAALTKTGALVGTPTYLSPEQAEGAPATSASDVHALGAVLFEAITGAPPYRRDDLPSLLFAIGSEAPERPGALALGVPPALDEVCLLALAKAPAARPSAGALAAELEAIVAGKRAATRRGRLPLALGVGAGGAALVAGLVALGRGPDASAAAAKDAPAVVRSARASAPAPEAPWVEPAWSRRLAARGDLASLDAALEVLDAGEELHPRTRARVLEVLAQLDAGWVYPQQAEGTAAEINRMLWVHWLWKRLEPAHVLSAEGDSALDSSFLWTVNVDIPPERLARIGLATVALRPDDVNAYVLYLQGTDLAPRTRDPALLRAGIDAARRAGNRIAWGRLAHALAWRLLDAGATPEARQEVLALARDPLVDQPDAPRGVHDLVVLVADQDVTTEDEERRLVERGLSNASGPVPGLALRRARFVAGGGDDEATAAAVVALGDHLRRGVDAALATQDSYLAMSLRPLLEEVRVLAGETLPASQTAERLAALATPANYQVLDR